MRTFVLAELHLRSLWNWRSIYLGRLIEPVAYLAFMVVGLNSSVSGIDFRGATVDYGQYALPGVLALLGVRAGTATVSDFSNDRKWGVFAFARSVGISPFGYFASLVLAALPLFWLQATCLILLAALVIPGAPIGSAALVAVAVLPFCLAFWIALGATIGAVIQSYSQRDLVLSLSSLPLIMTAPLFFSLENAPVYLRFMSWINPLTYQTEFVRGLVLGDSRVLDGAVTAALLLAVLGLAIWRLSKAEWLTSER